MRARWRSLTLLLVAGILCAGLLSERRVQAGGPLIVGGGSAGFGVDALPFTWDMTGVASPLVSGGQIQYRTDGGPLSRRSDGTVAINNSTANARVQAMFQVWEDVSSSTVAFDRAGPLLTTGAFGGGNVDTVTEFDAVEASCNPNHPQAQNPIVYDQDGTLFTALGFSSGVIGFAGPCTISTDGIKNSITAALAALNGKFRDGDFANGELTDNEFDAVFIHEFGHFFGLDHSQINVNCLGGCADFSDDSFGLPTMFPFLLSGLEETSGVHPARTLSTDDIAWVSRLYPAGSFSSSFGTIQGVIFFSDGTTPGQGFNVIARQVDDPGTSTVNESRRVAVSVVSGYLFTANRGQTVTGDNNTGDFFGSRNTSLIGFYEIPGLPPGSYTVEIEAINGAFVGGSGVGPIADLGFQFPLPGPPEFFNNGESDTDNPADSNPVVVSAGGTVSGINIIMNNTPPGLDALEPNTSVGTATPISNGTVADLSISPFGNEDFYSFGAAANTTVTVEIFAQRLSPSSFLDSVLEIVNASGTRLNLCRPLGSTGPFTNPCLNDDLTLGSLLDSGLEFRSSTPGTFFLHILDWRGDGRPDLQYELALSGAVGGTISASPNPCTLSGSTCTSTISWSTSGVSSALVTVQDTGIGGSESNFGSGTSNPGKDAPWIQGAPHQYTFRLYDTTGGGMTLLDSVVVTAVSGGTISASPNPCTLSGSLTCTSTISWSTSGASSALVTVQDTGIGGSETNFGSGTSNPGKDAPWIQGAPHQYTFRLYDTTGGGMALLDSVVVTASP